MTIDQAIAYHPHSGWPKWQGGGPCECRDCTEARRLRSEAAAQTRQEALRRGLSQSVADRAASYRLSPEMTVDLAIDRAIVVNGEQAWEDDVAAHDHAHGDDSLEGR